MLNILSLCAQNRKKKTKIDNVIIWNCLIPVLLKTPIDDSVNLLRFPYINNLCVWTNVWFAKVKYFIIDI